MSDDDNQLIIESFFDIYNQYLEMQFAIELCRPHFELPQGKELVDDLLRIAMTYGLRCEALLSEYHEVLSSPDVLKRMGLGIIGLADRTAAIEWPPHLEMYNSIINSEFSDYITSALISTNSPIHVDGFLGREWQIVQHNTPNNLKELICKREFTREWSGAHILWEDNKIRQIGIYEDDSPVLIIYMYRNGIREIFRGSPPVPIEVAIDEGQYDEKNNSSEISWGPLLIGTAGGIIISSLLQSKRRQTQKRATSSSTIEQKIMR